MTNIRETNEHLKEWTAIIMFAVLAGMTIVGILLIIGELP
jgi:hypothetical protein